jgi:hypothetical protein
MVQTPRKIKLKHCNRKTHTPSNLAKRAGKSCAMDNVESQPFIAKTWFGKDNAPTEKEGDEGWKPGPASRTDEETFTGAPCGVVDQTLKFDSKALPFFLTQVTLENQQKIMKYTYLKMKNSIAAKKAAGKKLDGIDRAIKPEDLVVGEDDVDGKPEYYLLWMAAKIKLGSRSKGYNSEDLWARDKGGKLNNSLPLDVYKCLNRYMCFDGEDAARAHVDEEEDGGGSDGDDDEEDSKDEEQEKEEDTDSEIASKLAAKARGSIVHEKSHVYFITAVDNVTCRQIAAKMGLPVKKIVRDNWKDEPDWTTMADSKLAKKTKIWLDLEDTCALTDSEDEDEEMKECEEESNEASSSTDMGPQGQNTRNIHGYKVKDRLSKRREVMSDIMVNWPAAYHPCSQLSLDEMVREHKKWYCIRLKFKPNVHSGTLVDALTCCRSKYCLSAEEQGTHQSRDNSIPARVARLVAAARATHKWHTVHVDRGYATIATAEALRKDGCHYNINIPLNRKGLPRVAMAMVAAGLEDKWEWAVWHKGEMELVVWNDGKPVYFISSVFTCAKVGCLKRSTSKATECYFVDTPEMSFAYNVWGRSGTDGHDQFRKNHQIANKRVLRDGVKGMLFTFDICLTNACILKRVLVESEVERLNSGMDAASRGQAQKTNQRAE